MKWVLIVTIVIFGNGNAVSVDRIGVFDTKAQCEIAGKEYTRVNTSGWSAYVRYVCIESYT